MVKQRKYAYKCAKANKDKVEDALKAEWTPHKMRNSWIAEETDLSEATTQVHLKKLIQEGKVQQFDYYFIHKEVFEQMDLQQLNKLKDCLVNKKAEVSALKRRIKQELEFRKEFLREGGKKHLSSNQLDQEIKEIGQLENHFNHLERRYEHLRSRILALLQIKGRGKSKDSSSSIAHNPKQPTTVSA